MIEENKITRWSFSRITPHCLRSWHEAYINDNRGENNCFSEYGTVGHDILEHYHKGEYFNFELEDAFKDKFNKEVTYDFPPNKYVDLKERYYEAGVEFFSNNVDEFFNDYELLEVEEEREWEIEGIKFVGFPDYVGRYKKNNKIHLIDYKSSSPYKPADRKEKVKQLYLYSIPIKEIYGKYPEYLIFLHFRHNKPVKIKFKEEDLESTKQWAIEQVKWLQNLKEYPANYDSSFFCKYLCNHRDLGICDFKNK